jgi:hypothetical protein
MISLYITVPTNIAPMTLNRSDAIADLSDPNLVLGPRKRRPTERLLENGDPLVRKKARNESGSMLLLSSLTHPTHPTDAMPNPGQATNRAETGSSDCHNNATSDEGEAIVVDDSDDADEGETEGETVEGESTDEDDDAELGT